MQTNILQMSQPQKRKYVRRKKNVSSDKEETAVPPPPPTSSQITYSHITSIQDEEYEMSMMMDIIKMQEREEKERLEKEREKQIRDAEELEENIRTRDHNIKEILRKLKHGISNSELETKIIWILENTMETQDMHIHIDDAGLYDNICRYLGIKDDDKRGTIRLHESVKAYAKNLFRFTPLQR